MTAPGRVDQGVRGRRWSGVRRIRVRVPLGKPMIHEPGEMRRGPRMSIDSGLCSAPQLGEPARVLYPRGMMRIASPRVYGAMPVFLIVAPGIALSVGAYRANAMQQIGADSQPRAAASQPSERAATITRQPERAGNPVFDGWYADPEAVVFGDTIWIYPTFSARYDQQLHFDAFSSKDLVSWTRHERILAADGVSWARRAMWAPAVIEKAGRYYFFFAANDIQNDNELGGIGVAVSDAPGGPFTDYLGKPLIDRFHNGAQPIDQFVFRDDDGTDYLIYGGWRHCNITKLTDDYRGLSRFEDGTTFKEITPDGYVEGPVMFRRGGKYYFMWSEGGWTGPDYSVAYAIADSPLGPFERIGKVLQQDPDIATGAGHHSVIKAPGTEDWYIVYHRRPKGETDRDHRVVCIDRMEFDAEGRIKPVAITTEGVERLRPRQ